ncbi:MAG: hypothetical protein HY860_03855 [Chlamydiales bacterium]|nr:hypothetical protein [Chlamydiales bacterium]
MKQNLLSAKNVLRVPLAEMEVMNECKDKIYAWLYAAPLYYSLLHTA